MIKYTRNSTIEIIEPLKVKITGCNDLHNWYKDKIGEVFEIDCQYTNFDSDMFVIKVGQVEQGNATRFGIFEPDFEIVEGRINGLLGTE